MEFTEAGKRISAHSIVRRFCRDLVHLGSRPGGFFEALPETLNRQDYLIFLALTAVCYSIPASLFVTAHRTMFIALHLIDATLMPVVTALIIHAFLRVLCPGRYSFELLLGVTAYANVVLLLAWIPGVAPWGEILKYVLIGLGLVKTGKISALKAFSVIFATAVVLVVMIFFFQYMLRS